MREHIEARLAELKAERTRGEQALAELVTKHAALRDTLLRIGGAIQVLEEVDPRPNETASDTSIKVPFGGLVTKPGSVQGQDTWTVSENMVERPSGAVVIADKAQHEALWTCANCGGNVGGHAPPAASKCSRCGASAYGTGQDKDAAPSDFRHRLLRLFQEIDNTPSGPAGAACAGAMKDLLIELGMEWSEKAQAYVFPTPDELRTAERDDSKSLDRLQAKEAEWPCAPPKEQTSRDAVLTQMAALHQADRAYVLGSFHSCGSTDLRCQCENDE